MLRWDADLEEQDRKTQGLEDQRNKDRKSSQTGPDSSLVDTCTQKPSKSSIEQLGNEFSASPETEVEVKKFDTLATLLGHKKKRNIGRYQLKVYEMVFT